MSDATKFSIGIKGQRITATGTSAVTQFTAGNQRNAAALGGNIMIANPGTVGVYVVSGVFTDTPVADNTCMYIPGGTVRAFRKPASHDSVALLSSGANQDIIVYHGAGD